MSDIKNLYNDLVNFYNVNDENFKEFMAKLYEEMLANHRDVKYVKEHLTEEIVKKLDEYLVDGKIGVNIQQKVEEFLNNTVIEDINTDIKDLNTDIKDLNSQLDTNAKEIEKKADKIDTYKKIDVDNKIWSMANMGQDVKEALTGGNVAVVGENSVLTENIVTHQIIKEKTDFFNYYENLLDPRPVNTDKVWYWNTSENKVVEKDSTGHTTYNRIKLIGGVTYSFKDIRGGSLLVSSDLTTKIGELSTENMFAGTYTPTKDCWLYPYYYSATDMSNKMIVNSSEYWCIGANKKLEYGKKYKRTIGDIDLDSILTDILTINEKMPNKINVQAVYEELYKYIDLKYKIKWALGGLNNQGGYGASDKRICTTTMQYAETDIILSTDYTKYRIGVYTYDKKDNPTITGNSGWITQGSYTIPKGTYYMLQTSALNDSETFTEVYNDCFNAIRFETAENLDNKLNNITSNEKPLLFGLSPMKTRIIMHRGYSNKAPDNTVTSFTLAGQTAECWGIETDARVLTDNTIVCFHDTELDNHTTGTGAILDKSYADIKDVVYNKGVGGLSEYPNEKIALFSDYLKICRKYGKVAVIELKPQTNINNIDKIVNMVNSYNMRNSVIYISFEKEYIDRVLKIDKKAVVQKLYLVNDTIDYDNFNYDSIGLEIESWGQTDNNIIETNLRKLQSRGVLISTWTTDTASTKRSLENKCVDFITTNLIN